MFLESPIWLWALLPWGAAVVYLWINRGRSAVVPFLRFWKGSATITRHRGWRRPPIFILLVLMALLLAIVAAAQPVWRGGSALTGDVSIVLDCGSTMARPGSNGKPFRGMIDRCETTLGPVGGKVSINPVPGQQVVVAGSAWAATARTMSPTLIATRLDQTVADQLRQTRGCVVVLSDQKLAISNSRIMQIVPDKPVPEVAIIRLAARSRPHPQVMIRLENRSLMKSIRLRVSSGDVKSDREVTLGSIGKTQDEFFDLSSLGQIVSAEIEPAAQADPWSKAYLVRESAGIHLEAVGDLPPSVRRMVDVYSKDRPAGQNASEIFVADHPLGENHPGVSIDQSTDGGGDGTPVIRPHAVTRDVKNWPAKGKQGAMPPGFSAVVTAGETPIVAVRETPVRQVWIGGNFQDWKKTTDFVVFFGNVFDWIAEANQQYVSTSPALLGADWKGVDDPSKQPGGWPGIYRSAAGRLRAVNAGACPPDSEAKPTLPGLRTPHEAEQNHSLIPQTIYAALACLLLAVFAWPAQARI